MGISEILIFGKEGAKLNILTPKKVIGTITASSSLNPTLAYGADNVMDFKTDVGWAEGNAGNGIGESINFSTTSDILINRLKIWNGYQRSPSHFSANSRLKKFQFGIKGGQLATYEIADSDQAQMISLEAQIRGKEFVLVVNEVFPGEKYSDLVLSEIRFFDDSIHIQTSTEEKRVLKNTQNEHAILSQYLDQNVNVSLQKHTRRGTDDDYYSEYSSSTQSLILRSNNTFVLYQREMTSVEEYRAEDDYLNNEGESKEVIADGNWEIKSEGTDQIRIRIFGKIYSPTTQAELYKGDVSSTNVRIFQDFLTLKRDKITGERFINDIIIKN